MAQLPPARAAAGRCSPLALPILNLRLSTAARRRVCASSTYEMTFKLPDGTEATVPCPDDQYILDAADEAGLELPYSCRAGAHCDATFVHACVDVSTAGVLDSRSRLALPTLNLQPGPSQHHTDATNWLQIAGLYVA